MPSLAEEDQTTPKKIYAKMLNVKNFKVFYILNTQQFIIIFHIIRFYGYITNAKYVAWQIKRTDKSNFLLIQRLFILSMRASSVICPSPVEFSISDDVSTLK